MMASESSIMANDHWPPVHIPSPACTTSKCQCDEAVMEALKSSIGHPITAKRLYLCGCIRAGATVERRAIKRSFLIMK